MESPNFTQVQTLKNPQLQSHNSFTRRGAARKCKHPQSSDHRSVPPGAGTTPSAPRCCLQPPHFPEQMKTNLIILRLHSRPQAQLPHLCSPRVSAAPPTGKICSKTCLTSRKMTIFFSLPFYFAVKVQGGAGTQVVAVLFFLLEGVKNGTIWRCDFISTCACAL